MRERKEKKERENKMTQKRAVWVGIRSLSRTFRSACRRFRNRGRQGGRPFCKYDAVGTKEQCGPYDGSKIHWIVNL